MAEIMNNEGKIKTYDNDIIRLEKVKDNSKKLGINIIETYLNDSSKVTLLFVFS